MKMRMCLIGGIIILIIVIVVPSGMSQDSFNDLKLMLLQFLLPRINRLSKGLRICNDGHEAQLGNGTLAGYEKAEPDRFSSQELSY